MEDKSIRQRLVLLRQALLNLHKVLIESERVRYEKIYGKVRSRNEFLQALIGDPWFAWLRPLAELIVAMDEALEGKEPLTVTGIESLMRQSDRLVAPSDSEEGFGRHYLEALQRDPDVVLAHAQVAKLRGPRNVPD